MRYVKNYVYLYVYIEFCAEAMVEMKKYIKPEIEIVEFDVQELITDNYDSLLPEQPWETGDGEVIVVNPLDNPNIV